MAWQKWRDQGSGAQQANASPIMEPCLCLWPLDNMQGSSCGFYIHH